MRSASSQNLQNNSVLRDDTIHLVVGIRGNYDYIVCAVRVDFSSFYSAQLSLFLLSCCSTSAPASLCGFSYWPWSVSQAVIT